jgi:hypothetical protein
MNVRQRTGDKRALVDVNSTSPVEIIPPASGYSHACLQICLTEASGASLRKITLMEGSGNIFPFTLGASGTIIWDITGAPLELAMGSGLYGRLDSAGAVTVLARYVSHDQRTPTNLNPATYIPRAIRKPNELGDQ